MKKLYRSVTDKYVFGIIGGLGDYFQVDSTLMRLAFVFFVLITGFFPGVLAYLIAYFIVPENPKNVVHHTEHKAKESEPEPDSTSSETELL
ncbi:MAG: PspC domain-containing protein [bacterium]